MPRKLTCAPTLACATTKDLIDEIRRRSLGCMIVCVRAEEDGDAWVYALKGSPILMGAMSAALSMQTTRKLSSADDCGHAGAAAEAQ
ncbi:MAG TPA: hypothetical protein VEJ63_08870 [Planctomycetota bacterium]|nr:hypothetical protein [Planctomycetota bacterium]